MLNLFKSAGKAWISQSKLKRQRLAREAKLARKLNKQKLQLKIEPQPDTPKIPFDNRPIEALYRKSMEEVLQFANQEVREAYSAHNASGREIKQARIREVIKRWGTSSWDTGNPAVQVATVTETIYSLTQHLRFNHKDVTAFLKLRARVDQRRRLLHYLKRYDYHLYADVTEALGIPEDNYPNHKEVKRMKIF